MKEGRAVEGAEWMLEILHVAHQLDLKMKSFHPKISETNQS
jgi:hypothetical protein